MIRDKAYLVAIHRYSHKSGVPAEIVGVEMIQQDKDSSQRLCYHVVWSDTVEDWISIENENYKIISFNDILAGNIPKVTE